MNVTALLAAALLGFLPLASSHAGASFASATSIARADCRLNPIFKVERRLVYRFTSTTEVLPPAPAGDAKPRVYSIDATLRLTCLGIGDDGGASFAVLFDKVKFSTTIDGNETSHEITRAEAEAAAPLAEDAETPRMLAQLLAAAAARADVRADGTVSQVTGLEAVHTAAIRRGVEGARLIGPLSADSVRRTVSSLFRIDAPPASSSGGAAEFSSRAAGATWTITDRVPIRAGSLVWDLALTLDSCSPEEAKLSGATTTRVAPPEDQPADPAKRDPTQPVLSIDEQAEKVSILWDPTAGALKERTREGNITISAVLGAARSQERLRSRGSIKLVELVNP